MTSVALRHDDGRTFECEAVTDRRHSLWARPWFNRAQAEQVIAALSGPMSAKWEWSDEEDGVLFEWQPEMDDTWQVDEWQVYGQRCYALGDGFQWYVPAEGGE